MKHGLLAVVGEMCFELASVGTYDGVRDCLSNFATFIKASYYLLGMRTSGNVVKSQHVPLTNYPPAWRHWYDSSGAFAYDPVVAEAFKFGPAFRWDGLHKSPKQIELLKACQAHGMNYGIAVSERGSFGSLAILSFCGPKRIATGAGEWERMQTALSMILRASMKKVDEIAHRDALDDAKVAHGLTVSELKCLELMVDAMTAEEAAREMNVAPRTIRFYLDRIAEKLGVATRREAIIKAVADGVIDVAPLSYARFMQSPSDDPV